MNYQLTTEQVKFKQEIENFLRSSLTSELTDKVKMIIKKKFGEKLDLSDKVYISFIMAIDSVYFSKSLFGLLRSLALLPIGITIDKIDRMQYFKAIKKLLTDSSKKALLYIQKLFFTK